MKPEDKRLVFQDLCARLPYHVRCKVWLKYGTTEEGPLDLQHNYGDVLRDAFFYHEIKDIKPYLRSLSSMTEEEREDFWKNVLDIDWRELDFDEEPDEVPFPFTENYCGFYLDNFYLAYSFAVIDWLNKKMFDYRGLIDRGLAIEVTEDNNPYKD